MNTEHTITFRGDYVHVQHSRGFLISAVTMPVIWRDIAEACRKYSCSKVLVEGAAPTIRMSVLDQYKSGGALPAEGMYGVMVALCLTELHGEETGFLEDVSSNRGVPIKFFTDRQEAAKWLGVELKDEKKQGSLPTP